MKTWLDSTRLWLEHNKIFFETLMATSVAIAAFIVSYVQTNFQSKLLQSQNSILIGQAMLAETARRSDDARIVDQIIDEVRAYTDGIAAKDKSKPLLLPDSLHNRVLIASRLLEPYQRLELPGANGSAQGTTMQELVWSPLLSPEKGRLLQHLSFLNVSLVGPWSFAKIDGRHADFHGCTLSAFNFGGLDLRSANFRDTDLSVANLSGTDLRDADFTEAYLAGAILHATLDKANFTNAYLGGTFGFKGCLEQWRKSPDGPRGITWTHWQERPVTKEEAAKEYSAHFLGSGKDQSGLFGWPEIVVIELCDTLDKKKLYSAAHERGGL